MVVAPSLNLTLPVGALPFTVALSVTMPPKLDGLIDVPSSVALPELTFCVRVGLLDPALPASPA